MAQNHPITSSFLLGKETTNFYKKYFKEVNPHITANNKNIFLLKEVADAFEKLYQAAKKDGIKLTLLSGFRSFEKQKQIWQFKYHEKYRHIKLKKERIEKIMNFSSMPGTSRHHWGTEIDVVSLNNAFFKKGYGKKVFLWLKKNGPAFGFFQVYTPGRFYGYNEESWHFTYLPLSQIYLKSYQQLISAKDIRGFDGDFLVKKLNIIQKYVFGINPKLF